MPAPFRIMESKKKNLFYCYNKSVANHLISYGLVPVTSGINHRTKAAFWAFERGPMLDDGLDRWQKQKWFMKPDKAEEAEDE